MTDQNQLLREALQDIEQAHDLSLDLDHYAGRQVLVSLADKIKVALAQPAEGGEVCNVKSSAGLIRPGKVDAWVANHYTNPPASQDQAQQPSMICKTCGADRFKEPCKNPTTCTMVGESQAQQPSESPCACWPGRMCARQSQCASDVQQPSHQAWANETGLRQIECPSCGDLAVAYDPQQPSGEVFEKLRSAASLAWEAMEKHRQFKGEAPCGMLGVRAMEELREAMRLAATFPDAATPKPEPMPETVRVWANSPELVEDGNQWQQGYEHARAWVHAQLSITKGQA